MRLGIKVDGEHVCDAGISTSGCLNASIATNQYDTNATKFPDELDMYFQVFAFWRAPGFPARGQSRTCNG